MPFLLTSNSLKLVDKYIYGSDINTRLAKTWSAIDWLSVVRKSDLSDKRKRKFFQAAVVSILLYGYTTWTLTKRMEKKLQIRRTRHCWRSKCELLSDTLLWTLSHARADFGRPARTYQQQISTVTGHILENLPNAMDDRDEWRGRVKEICARSQTWWWWWWCIYIYIYIYIFEDNRKNIIQIGEYIMM